MADRSVTYTFRGNFTNLGAGLATMGAATADLGRELTGLDQQGATSRRGLTQLGNTAGKMGLVAAAGVGAIVLAAANFDAAMSNVAATGQDARDSLDDLREAAIKAGAATKFSATEAAEAEEALAKAGVSAADVLGGGLQGALDLAAAGQLGVADAAEIAATAMTQFKLSGEDVPHIADLLAAGAGKAQGEVTDMAQALKQSGLVAAQMGISVEETAGVLAEFASAGLLGSDAGTSFRTMLLRLANPTKESADLMASLGIAAYDTSGNFVGMEAIAGQLTKAFEGKTQAERDSALATIFGSDAIRAASVLYQNGADGVADWTAKVDDAGFAAETAAIKMNNLKGDLEQLKGSLETALIGAGEGGQGPLRGLVQGLTDVVNAFNKLPSGAQNATTGLLAVSAVMGLGIWAGAKIIGGIAATRLALQQLGISAATTARAMTALKVAGGLLVGLTLAAVAIRAVNEAARDTLPGVQSLTEGLLNLKSSGDISAIGDEFKDLGDDLDRLFSKSADEKLGDALFTPFKGILGNTRDTQEALDEIEALDEALANLVTTRGPQAAADALQSLADSGAITKDQLSDLRAELPQYEDALAGARLGADGAATATGGLAAATSDVAEEAVSAEDAIEGLVEAMEDQRTAALDAFDAVSSYRQAVKDADKQARHSTAGIKDSSKAALENRGALSQLAGAWNSQSAAVTDNVAKYKEARDNFIKTAVAMGVPKKAAKELADELLELPAKKYIPVDLPGVDVSIQKARTLKEIIDATHSKDIIIRTHTYTVSENKPHASAESGSSPRTSSRGLNTRVPSLRELDGTKDAYAAQALGLLAKNSSDAAKGAKGLKEKLADAERHLDKMSRAADAAHDALQSLKDQRADLASSVSGSLSNDPFGGNLAEFNTVTNADTAAAQAVLAALQTLVANGLDPHSDLFKKLAASGNVALIQEFAALTGSQLAAEAASFAAGQGALGAVGQFAGNAAFNDLISAQSKVTNKLDHTVDKLADRVHGLEKAIDAMADKVKKGSHDGTREGSEEGAKRVVEALTGQAVAGHKRGR